MSKMDLICKWFKKAEDDLIVAKHLFEDLYPKQIEIICYHAQQSIEKALKGFLVYNDIEAPKTHSASVIRKKAATGFSSSSSKHTAYSLQQFLHLLQSYPENN